jgi:hypothetical protein
MSRGDGLARLREALEEHACHPRGSDISLRARCPVHGSRGPTLAVSQGRAGALVKCHAQCATADVLTALGLSWDDLFDEPRERRADWAPRPRQPEPGPGGVLIRALGIIGLREWHRAFPLLPRLSAQERVELAEWGSQRDADAHYWRTLARYAALASDEDYIRRAYALPPGQRTHEQNIVLMTRREDLERAGEPLAG